MSKGRLTQDALSGGFDEWETPKAVYDALSCIFGFTLDPCATEETKKCFNYFTKEQDGLAQSWAEETVFVNPPYSEVEMWIEKGISEMANNATSVFLVPARTDTKWFAKAVKKSSQIIFISGRIKFLKAGVECKSPPFPSVVIVFDPKWPFIDRGPQFHFMDRKFLYESKVCLRNGF